MNQNPYDGPVYSKENAYSANRSISNYDRSSGPRVFVDGPYLVVENGSVLPNRCPVTNEPVADNQAEPRIFTWTPDYLILFFLCCSIIVFLLAYLILRRQCTVWVSISPMVKQRMSRSVMRRIFYFLGSIVTIAISIYFELFPGVAVGFLLLLVSLFLCLIPIFPVRVTKQEHGLFWLNGCHPEFLNMVANGNYSVDKRLY